MKKETKKLSQLTKTLRFQIASDGDQELSETIRAYIAVYNAVIDYSVLKNVTDPLEINKALYHRLRAQYPNLPCALQQSARNCACEAMKSEWTKAKNRAKKKKQPTPTTLLQLRRLPRMKITAAMRYTSTTLTLRGQQLTFSTNGKRRRVILTPPTAFQDTFKNWNCKSGTIAYRDGVIHINLTFKTPAPQILQPASVDQVIGCDAGIHHVLTLSSMLFFSAAVVRMLQRRYLYNRKTLQAKGTSSSRKRLKAIGQREQRFNRDVNHCISKKLIALPYNL